jgi:predicted nucleic acid-binding protein
MLVDAGPLVALLNARDDRHQDCLAVLRSTKGPLVTVWPAVTEAMYLLGESWSAQNNLWGRIVTGAVLIAPIGPGDYGRMRSLMEKYRDLPMDLADAALVCVAEREEIARVFTIDRRDFERYRPRGLGHFTIVP